MSTEKKEPQRRIERLLEIVARLRGENGCPWDREQTLDSLKRFLIEESYEVLEAIESGHPQRHCEELGDVLLQVVLQARIREEQGAFTFDDVLETLTQKLVRRHPHVFGDARVADAREVLKNWERIKAAERGKDGDSTLESLPRHLPALQRAEQVQSRAARHGFDWDSAAGVVAKIDEEVREIKEALAAQPDRAAEEIGDLLFAVVNLCRHLGIHPEEALNRSTARFVERFRKMQTLAQEAGRTFAECSPAEMDAYWEAVKNAENSHHG